MDELLNQRTGQHLGPHHQGSLADVDFALMRPAQDFLAQELADNDRVVLDGEAQPLAEARGLLQPGPLQLAQAHRGRLLVELVHDPDLRSLQRGAGQRGVEAAGEFGDGRQEGLGRLHALELQRMLEGRLGRGDGLLDQGSLLRLAEPATDGGADVPGPLDGPILRQVHLLLDVVGEQRGVVQPIGSHAPVVHEVRRAGMDMDGLVALQRLAGQDDVGAGGPDIQELLAPYHNHGFVRGDLRDLIGLEHLAPFVHRVAIQLAEGLPHFPGLADLRGEAQTAVVHRDHVEVIDPDAIPLDAELQLALPGVNGDVAALAEEDGDGVLEAGPEEADGPGVLLRADPEGGDGLGVNDALVSEDNHVVTPFLMVVETESYSTHTRS